MTHIPTKLDLKADIFRSLTASVRYDTLDAGNPEHFLLEAKKNAGKLKLDLTTRKRVDSYFRKAEDKSRDIEKRREDLLMVACII